MLAILRSTARMPLSPAIERHASSPSKVDRFVVDDRNGLVAARASVRVDVCPITKTIVGFSFSLHPFSSAQPATVAVRKLGRKEKPAARNPGGCLMPGMPKTLVVDCPKAAVPTFRDAG